MKRGTVIIAAIAAIFSLLEGASQAQPRISGAEFARRADAICLDYRRRTLNLPRPAPGDFAGVYKLAVATLAIAGPEVAKVRALPLPRLRRARAQAWVATRNRFLVLLRGLRAAAHGKSLQRVESASAALNANGARAHRLAAALGMKICSRAG
jgi:hypothetical protein